jgi:ABC-2 type transport system ATP-binding protein
MHYLWLKQNHLLMVSILAEDCMQDNAIVVENIHKTFGDVKALNGVDLVAQTGQILGLLGPNGAGKTTLVRILTTLLPPDSGSARINGIDVAHDPEKIRDITGLAGQYPAVDEQLTGRENLVMVGRLYHFSSRDARQRAKELLARFGLEDAADRPVKTYSGGMRRRLDLAASIVARPPILFLDEPTTGLDARSRRDLWEMIHELVRDGATLLLTTQYLEEADQLADRIVLIDQGRVAAEGTPAELKSRFASDVIELRLSEREKVQQAASLLEQIGRDTPQTEPDIGLIKLSVNNGAQSLIEVVHVLDSANISIANVALRQPSLDDVFLSLTEKKAGEPQ